MGPRGGLDSLEAEVSKGHPISDAVPHRKEASEHLALVPRWQRLEDTNEW
jgi:hypothetical protein